MNYKSNYGIITSPNYGSGPYPNVDCIMMVQSTSGRPLTLKFIDYIRLEDHVDFLHVSSDFFPLEM